MTRILIIYHSQGGNTETMAQWVAGGVRSIEDIRLDLKPAGSAILEDLLTCDGLAIGSPEYFGAMAGRVKDFFDRTYEPARKDKRIFKKPYVVFISAGNDGRGALSQIERICLGYPLKKVYEPVIARGALTEEIREQCEELGKTLAAGCQAGIY
ncbi:MAG: NAD(P)H-dependent oxidoreductase [Deltaproteobacteria bacterium]